MQPDNKFPQTLHEAIQFFAREDNAFDFMVNLRWAYGVECPRCESKEVSFISSRKVWECKHCKTKKQFSAKVGTIFEDSPVGLDKWFCAIWLLVNAKNGISSYELHRSLGVTQKTAWFMLQRIRVAMRTGSFKKMSGHVEADETFIGAKARNLSPGRRAARGGDASFRKTAVLGLLERNTVESSSRVHLKVVESVRRFDLDPEVRERVEKGSNVYTDKLRSYEKLADNYVHQVIDHAECYAKGLVHTNGLENFWSLLKRAIRGTYVNVEPFHLFRYLDEQAFRFNERKDNDAGRFIKAAVGIIGKGLRYAELTGKGAKEGETVLPPPSMPWETA